MNAPAACFLCHDVNVPPRIVDCTAGQIQMAADHFQYHVRGSPIGRDPTRNFTCRKNGEYANFCYTALICAIHDGWKPLIHGVPWRVDTFHQFMSMFVLTG